MISIKLSAFREYGSKIRVNDQFVVSSIDMSELCYLIKHTQNHIPGSFLIQGKEKTIEVFPNSCEKDADGDVRTWSYQSRDVVETRDGPRKVAITVFND